MARIIRYTLLILLIAVPAFCATHTVCDTGGPCDYTSTTFNALTGTGYAGDTFYFSGTFTAEIAPHISGTAIGGYVTLDGYQTDDTTYMNLSEVAGRALIDRTAGSGVFGIALWKSAWGNGNGSDYLIIQDFEITDVRNGVYAAENCDHILFKRNYIHETTGFGIWMGTASGSSTGCSYMTVGGSLGHGNVIKNIGNATAGGDVVFAHGDNVIVSYNHLYADNSSYGVDGVDPMNDSHNWLVEYNNIHGHNSQVFGEDGIDVKTDYASGTGVHDGIIRYNHVYDHKGIGGEYPQSNITIQTQTHHVYIYGNKLHNSNWGSVYIKEGECATGCTTTIHDVWIFSNLMFDEEDAAIRIHATNGGTSTDPYNIYMFNNTFAENGINEHGSTFTHITAANLNPGATFIKNNIFYKSREGKSDPEHQAYFLDDITDKSNIDYNIYYWPTKTSETYLGGSWAAAIGGHALADVNSSEEDPGLTDIANNDYTIASGAAVIAAGDDLGTGAIATLTIQGTSYPVYWDAAIGNSTVWGSGATLPVIEKITRDSYDAWDIGAYQSGGPVISSPKPTSQQGCGDDPQTVEMGVTSSANATCRYSAKGADTCATAYADLDTEFLDTTDQTTHITDISQACDGATTYVIICNDDSTSLDSNCLEITVDVAAAEGAPPQPSPEIIAQIGAEGNITIVGNGTLLIH